MMHYLLEHFGVAVAATTGVLAASGKKVDLFGIVVLALVTALGGGTLRDVILGSWPVFWIADANYLLNAVGTAVVVFYVARVQRLPQRTLVVADAFALAFFTIIGLQKALTLGAGHAIALTMGVITGVAGGIFRDVLLGEIPLVFQPHIHIYATAALAGGLVFLTCSHYLPSEQANLVIGTLAVLLLRLAGIRWRLTLPVFEYRDNDGARR